MVRQRNGSILVATILGLLLIELLAVGGLALARAAVADARIRTRTLQARLGAESAVGMAITDWTAQRLDTLSTARSVRYQPAGIDGYADIERVASHYLVRGYHPFAGPRVLAEWRVFTLPTDSIAGLFDAALHTESATRITLDALVDGTGTAPLCAGAADPVPGIAADLARLTVAPSAQIAGSPPVSPATTPSARTVSGIPVARLQALADIAIDGVVTPAPVAAGETCASDPNNWGDPDGSSPCADRVPLIVARADVTIAGGVGQGVLVVPGTLRMIGEARFDGIVLAGAVDLGDATVRGAIRTFGSDTTHIAGTVRYDGCAVRKALAAPALHRPFARGRVRLPVR